MSQEELNEIYGIELAIYFYYKILNDSPIEYSDTLKSQMDRMWKESHTTANILNWMYKNVGY